MANPTLSELLRLQEEATPGPYIHVSNRHGGVESGGHHEIHAGNVRLLASGFSLFASSGADDSETHAAYELFAAARNFDLKALATQYEAMRQRLEDAEKVIQWAEEGMSPSFMRIEASNYRKLHNVIGWEHPLNVPTRASLDTKARGDG